MTDLKEQAKRLIAKGKSLQDAELIQMGLDILDQYNVEEIIQPLKEVAVVKLKKPKIEKTVEKLEIKTIATSDFTMNKKNKKTFKAKSIVDEQRFNKFVDDKTEAMGPEFKTPVIAPSQRRPPVDKQKVDQVCEVCGKRDRVLPIYSREFYRCDACLIKGNKK
jgi:hypothetical protein